MHSDNIRQIDELLDGQDGLCAALLKTLDSDCAERDKLNQPIDREILASPGARRLLSASIPVAYGGFGFDLVTWGKTLEQVAKRCEDGSFTLLLSLFPAVANTLFTCGNDLLIDRYAKGIIDGDCLVAFAYSEEGDDFNFSSKMRKEGDLLVINGHKSLVTGGAIADGFMTYVAGEHYNETYVVMIDANDPGVEVLPLNTMGVRSAGMATLILRDVKLPQHRLISSQGGLSHAQHFLNLRRLLLSAASVGRMARTVNLSCDYANRTERYGKPLATSTAVQSKLGQMRIEYECAKAMVHRSLQALNQNLDGDNELAEHIAETKYNSAKASVEIATKAFEMMGIEAYIHPNPIERYIRDAFAAMSDAGQQDLLKINAGVKTLFDKL